MSEKGKYFKKAAEFIFMKSAFSQRNLVSIGLVIFFMFIFKLSGGGFGFDKISSVGAGATFGGVENTNGPLIDYEDEVVNEVEVDEEVEADEENSDEDELFQDYNEVGDDFETGEDEDEEDEYEYEDPAVNKDASTDDTEKRLRELQERLNNL